MLTKSSRYTTMFEVLEQRAEIAWIPFVMLGYPDMESSITFIETFIENGADALEIGIPFSDPVADGILIQETARVALENGSTVKKCMQALTQIRATEDFVPKESDAADLQHATVAVAYCDYFVSDDKMLVEHCRRTAKQVGVDCMVGRNLADVPVS